MITTLAVAGGLFALLVFNHFVVDWIFQTHHEAMNKTSSWKWRLRHCLVYATGFIPLLLFMGLAPWALATSWFILLASHFIIDTYIPVYLWAKYIRRIPDVREGGQRAFKALFGTPLGVVLFIAVDQIVHLLFLLPVVCLILM